MSVTLLRDFIQAAEALSRPEIRQQVFDVLHQHTDVSDIHSLVQGAIDGTSHDSTTASTALVLALRSAYRGLRKEFEKVQDDALAATDDIVQDVRDFASFVDNFLHAHHPVEVNSIRILSMNDSEYLLKRIVQTTKVQPFRDLEDVRTRIAHPRRKVLAFLDPYRVDEPIISVQVALTQGPQDNIQKVVRAEDAQDGEPDTATFYSISSTGASGVSLARELILAAAQWVTERYPTVKNYFTLSPITEFNHWLHSPKTSEETLHQMGVGRFLEHPLDRIRTDVLTARNFEELVQLPVFQDVVNITKSYILNGRFNRDQFRALNGVAHVHLGNGATAYRLNPNGDTSAEGFKDSLGTMINYRYIPERLDENAEDYRKGITARSSLMHLNNTAVHPLGGTDINKNLGFGLT